MTTLESNILSDLERHRGHRHAIKAGTLADWYEVSDRVARQAVEALIEVHGYPIAATIRPPYGYFLPETDDQADEYIGNLISRESAIRKRRRDFERNFVNWTGRQRRLGL